MFAKLRLGTKFTLLLLVVFVIGILVLGTTLWQVLQQKAQHDVTSTGLMLMETMTSVRSYTSSHISPLLAGALASQEQFIPETVPAFSAREVFEKVRQDGRYAAYFYKEAAPNPTNPRDRADEFEVGLVSRFRRERDLTEISGFRAQAEEQLYYIARPLRVNAESCLYCHGSVANAPASLLATYGPDGGFGWELDEIVAAQIIYVPAAEVFGAALRAFLVLMSIFVAVFAVAIFTLNAQLKRYVIQPIGLMGDLAQQISADKLAPEALDTSNLMWITDRADELGHLARLFREMAHEVTVRTQALRQQLQQLHIEIDEIKRERQVAEVVDNDFFRDLQAKARSMREKRR